MVMELQKIVPFGRSLDEYENMFALSGEDMNKRIIGVADGPASFNAEMSALGKSVRSVDPMYIFGATGLENRFYEVLDDIITQVKATPDDWVWNYHKSAEDLRAARINVLNQFLLDYEAGKREGRYVAGELPELQANDNQYDLALCSHFLFLYSDHLSYDFHLAAVREMLRVAPEVRIFPVLTLMLDQSPYLNPLVEQLAQEGFSASVDTVSYELQRGGNQMLRIYRA